MWTLDISWCKTRVPIGYRDPPTIISRDGESERERDSSPCCITITGPFFSLSHVLELAVNGAAPRDQPDRENSCPLRDVTTAVWTTIAL
jgi:hypothetical protein